MENLELELSSIYVKHQLEYQRKKKIWVFSINS